MQHHDQRAATKRTEPVGSEQALFVMHATDERTLAAMSLSQCHAVYVCCERGMIYSKDGSPIR